MQQRRLRLGDTLNDYCPRERRITNHVVVAMIGDDVQQTRCADVRIRSRISRGEIACGTQKENRRPHAVSRVGTGAEANSGWTQSQRETFR